MVDIDGYKSTISGESFDRHIHVSQLVGELNVLTRMLVLGGS